MNRFLALLASIFLLPGVLPASVRIADNGRFRTVIIVDPAATVPEKRAAQDLAQTLSQIVGTNIAVQELAGPAPRRAILVGRGAAARAAFPEVAFDKLGDEELVIRTHGNRLLLAGGRPRGTLYAVSRFLQDECSVRWWTPWASHIPKQPTLRVKDLDVRAKPAFESRDPFWYPAFDGQWAVRNFANGQSERIPEELGGSIRYKGFVHTFYPLIPPEEHFATHPEWYSLIKGKRTHDRAQLCLTNPKLREFMLERVKAWLRESPEARIISVSQNDWYGACECDRCKAMDDAEGTHAGTMLDLVNYIAEKIEPDFPQVAVDTLAYQYTRKPPKTLRPRPNVIVRLCSIECNFREPLDHPSNSAFADDIIGWSKICKRLYIWDYTTDFGHYVQPHANWFTLGPNVRFFHAHNVLGLFEQGAYQSHGSEMAEMRAWVLARLLWNPQQDDRALIHEFLVGYYGPAAAKPIGRYLDLMFTASAGQKLGCFAKTDQPCFQFKTLAAAEELWREAEKVAADNPEYLRRVRVGHLPLGYVWLSRWILLRDECKAAGAVWPLPASRREFANAWATVARGEKEFPWTKITSLSESGLTVDAFIARYPDDPQ